MQRLRFYSIISLVVFAAVFSCGRAFAFDDGFGSAKEQEGKYFTVYYAPSLDPAELSQQLNIGSADKILVSGSTEKWGTDDDFAGGRLADMLDTLFLQVSDILDMHIYSFHGNVKVCRDYAHLSSIYEELFGKELGGTYSLFVFDFNTIYVSPEHFSREVLGHEIAHAIISKYFVVQPPVKVSEVLSGYVEFQLRKSR